MERKVNKLFLLVSLFACCQLQAQTNQYAQFWNEFAFTRPAGKKFSLELNIGQTWTSTPQHNSMFSTNAQIYTRLWGHYYHSARWKFSAFLAYFYNKDVPEIKQDKAPEIRSALQAMYFFKKIPFTLNARFRVEDRKILDDNNVWEATYRFRAQMRCIYPINSKFIRGGTFYALACEELMFKSGSFVAGSQFFDRNRFTIGGGYALTDDIQVEITYANEYLPRSGANELYNAAQVNIVFNNLFLNLKEKLFKKNKPVESLAD